MKRGRPTNYELIAEYVGTNAFIAWATANRKPPVPVSRDLKIRIGKAVLDAQARGEKRLEAASKRLKSHGTGSGTQ